MKRRQAGISRSRGYRFSRVAALALAIAPIGVTPAEGGQTSKSEPVAPPAKSAPDTRYWLVVYRPGPAWRDGRPLHQQPLAAHRDYMVALYRQGILQLAGPFADDSGGAVMLHARSEENARTVVEADPAVAGGIFTYELRPWNLLPWEEIAAGSP